MPTFAVSDTIVAISSGRAAAPIGIVRLSGPAARELAESIGLPRTDAASSASPRWVDARAVLSADLSMPAGYLCFSSPRSYTGQDLIEIHVPGCVPVLDLLVETLTRRGARPALPGEFTARAYSAGKLSATQVDAVLGLISAESEAAAKASARVASGVTAQVIDELRDASLELLARVEAGIDFADEDDVQFISPIELEMRLNAIVTRLEGLTASGERQSRGRPHVVIAGLPNAGKSTLFNALLGTDRAIIAPVAGTTRDVISQRAWIGGVEVILQDTAGLGEFAAEVDQAATRNAAVAIDRANAVLWAHDATTESPAQALEACERTQRERRILVFTKSDLLEGRAAPAASVTNAWGGSALVCARSGVGLDKLRTLIAACIVDSSAAIQVSAGDERARRAVPAFERALEFARMNRERIACAELLAMELRDAWACLAAADESMASEQVLERIFTRFCIGK